MTEHRADRYLTYHEREPEHDNYTGAIHSTLIDAVAILSVPRILANGSTNPAGIADYQLMGIVNNENSQALPSRVYLTPLSGDPSPLREWIRDNFPPVHYQEVPKKPKEMTGRMPSALELLDGWTETSND